MPVRADQIKVGEPPCTVAQQYCFGSNRKPVLDVYFSKGIQNSRDKKRIPAGANMLIPQSKREDEEAARAVQSLLNAVSKDMTRLLETFNGYKVEAERSDAAADIAADVAFVAKVAAKANTKHGQIDGQDSHRRAVQNYQAFCVVQIRSAPGRHV